MADNLTPQDVTIERVDLMEAAGRTMGDNACTTTLLTVQMLLLGPHDLVRGGLAHRLGDGRAGDAVLRRGDPVGDALPRHPPRSQPGTL